MRIQWLMSAVMATALLSNAVRADMTLGSPFGDGMVLQRDMPVPVWGWAEPGQRVEVAFQGQTKGATAGDDGAWRVALDPLKADAAGAVLRVQCGGAEAVVKDVLVGEVWICSGQSNMAMALKETENAEAQIAAADFPKLRLLAMPVRAAALPQERAARAVAWRVCSPQTAGGFSAVAYFFGREVQRKLDAPVGLIVVATGATPIELWVPREGLGLTPELAEWAREAAKVDADYRQAVVAWEAGGKTSAAPTQPVHPYMVKNNARRGLGTFFNSAVAPVAGYPMRGMIWYQGESNRGDKAEYYFNLEKALIRGWRKTWGQGDFPFYYVQISALDCWRPDWHIPEIWAGQTMALQLPNTGMVVIHDLVKDIKNIHPKSKEEVGRRLALWAFARTYGYKEIPYAGPIYRSHQVEGDRIRVRFDYTFGGLKSRDGKPLGWFTLAGADGKFVPAQAKVDGDTVVVWSGKVKAPVSVRFAWSEAAQPNLANGAGLPASPFRSDGTR